MTLIFWEGVTTNKSEVSQSELSELVNASAEEELDVPLPANITKDKSQSVVPIDIPSYKALKEEERKGEKNSKGFKLIYICLISMGAIYLIDALCSLILFNKPSELANTAIDTVKGLAFAVAGYLFGKNEA